MTPSQQMARQGPPAKKKRHMGVAGPHAQTQTAALGAVHAAHAEPAGSAIQMSQPAAPVRRCVCLQEKHDCALLMQQKL